MRTLGIDLASQAAKTAACLIDWNESPPTILTLEIGLTDKRILDLADQLDLRTENGAVRDAIAIDAPFGWPQPFTEFVSRSPMGRREVSAWNPSERKRLSFRLTDLYVQRTLGLWPLAVSADKIALPAMRCSGLLDDLGVRDRSGVNGVFEVYPAAALKAWGLPHQKYKSEGSSAVLTALIGKVSDACSWPNLLDEDHSLCARDHDAFDAVMAALVGRAAALGLTDRPTDQTVVDQEDHVVPVPVVVERAKTEGWIALPKKNCRIGDLMSEALFPLAPSCGPGRPPPAGPASQRGGALPAWDP